MDIVVHYVASDRTRAETFRNVVEIGIRPTSVEIVYETGGIVQCARMEDVTHIRAAAAKVLLPSIV
ncbi:MAG TPA: hypothetical protein VJ323_02310 [Bryobacteraceae bacterium]|jgi:hypothetical protein|nr:hypothetical protein [Bryobacteraceae bacterium]